MEPQQLATKVTQLESRVATLEDEGKIIKGEVKQILTEIRSAILVRDNPFESDSARGAAAGPATQIITSGAPATKVEVVVPQPEPPAPEPVPTFEPEPEYAPPPPMRAPSPPAEPVMLRPQAHMAPEPEKPHWTLLTIAGLSAWAEDAIRRLGALRLEILLDMCEASGHLTHEARIALSRVTELELPEPEQAPSTNDTVVILRQLEALVNDEQDFGSGSGFGGRLSRIA